MSANPHVELIAQIKAYLETEAPKCAPEDDCLEVYLIRQAADALKAAIPSERERRLMDLSKFYAPRSETFAYQDAGYSSGWYACERAWKEAVRTALEQGEGKNSV